eukprot:GHVR01111417.1.p1 GENE.GHVR01111417.1~~GHVR01111417.1.p1  ORF type:complete len:108 (-),score=15.77 GHVR01111417.1:241-564(-)
MSSIQFTGIRAPIRPNTFSFGNVHGVCCGSNKKIKNSNYYNKYMLKKRQSSQSTCAPESDESASVSNTTTTTTTSTTDNDNRTSCRVYAGPVYKVAPSGGEVPYPIF